MKLSISTLLFLLLFCISLKGNEEARLMRFPAIYGDQVIFSYAGDLYTVHSKGGTARRLTSHVGYEMFPRFSPDGKHIAFTGQYDGNTEVYLIPAKGGNPRRLTYSATLRRDDIADRMGPNNIVMTWTPDGHIVYRSRWHAHNTFKGHLKTVDTVGNMPDRLPFSHGGFCAFSPDGKKLAMNKVFREFRTWKYYRGGMADDIWIFDFENKSFSNITQNKYQDIIPMWHENRVYFLSDRTRVMNLYMYDFSSGKTEKITDFKDFDIKFPSIGNDHIVFEKGGYLYKLNLDTHEVQKIEVLINNDFLYARSEIVDAFKRITHLDADAQSKRVLINARGDIFSLPEENDRGVTYNLTKTPGVHERSAAYSPDGKYIAYISDASGEYEIYIRPTSGNGKPVQLTNNAETYKFYLKWSPDSKKIMWNDKQFRLRYVHIDSKKVTTIDRAKNYEIYDFNWSPDSKWVTYASQADNDLRVIWLYHLESSKKIRATGNWYDSHDPAFSDDGKYLCFVSERDFKRPIFNDIEWNFAYENISKVYLLALSKETGNPLKPSYNTREEKEKNKEEEDVVTKVDPDGIENRIIDLPVSPSDYMYVNMLNNKVYYIEKKEGRTITKMYDLDKKEEVSIAKDAKYVLSTDQKKMLFIKSKQLKVTDIPTSAVSLDDVLALDQVFVKTNYQAEWTQIYNEAWRQMRDFFYVENMHGVNWNAMRDKYAPLVQHVRHRDDLTYVIGEMIGELNVGHAYINSGDRPKAERLQMGLLGAHFSKHESGYFKVDNVFNGANWNKSVRSPFTEIGVNIDKGDYILTIDGNSTRDVKNIYQLLIKKSDQLVELKVNDQPASDGARMEYVKTIDDETKLAYYNWVQQNIKKVNEASDGEIGYVHIPDMGVNGLNEFAKHYYPQLTKKVLIIDDRGNGGGNVSPMIIERLALKVNYLKMKRNALRPDVSPDHAFPGSMVLLIDEYSASDGDLFPYAFRKNKLGPIIGKRSWGGVVGIYGSLTFIDGTQLRKPESAHFSYKDGNWIIEGHGVEPDIEVENDIHQEYIGNDAQLQKAIEKAKVLIEQNYQPLPPIPAGPDKSE